MPKLLTDEDFNNDILAGLRKRQPSLDIVRVQDSGLMSLADGEILEWCSQRHRVLLSHDKDTMTSAAVDRLEKGLPFSGLILVPQRPNLGKLIEHLETMLVCMGDEEFTNCILHVPRR